MFRGFVRLFFRFTLLLSIFLFAGQTQLRSGISDNDFPLYKSIRNLQVQNKGVQVRGITIKKDAALIQLHIGDLWFFNPIEGKSLGAVFIGQGEIKINPTLKSEKEFLAKLTEGAPFEERFKELTLFFADDPFQPFKDKLQTPSTIPARKAQKLLDETSKLFRKRRKYTRPNQVAYFLPWNINARLLFELLNPLPSESFFLACGDGEEYGDFIYIEDPLGVPGHEPEEVALLNLSQKNLGSWYSAHFSSHYQEGRPRDLHPLRLIEVERYFIRAQLEGCALGAWTAMFFTPLQDKLHILPLNLDPCLRIKQVMDKTTKPVSFIQEKHDEDGNLSVILPEPLEKGKQYVLHFVYVGADSITDQGNGNFSLLDRSSWYPNPGVGAYKASFSFEFDIPANTRIVATGQKIGDKQKGDRLISIWKSKIPLKVAGFNYGTFENKVSIDKKSGFKIETCANKELPNELAEIKLLAGMIRDPNELSMLQSLNTVGMMDKVHAETQAAISIYSDCFGKPPYDRIAITQQPFYNFGQAWPTLIYMPITAFLPSIQKEIMGMNAGFYTRSFYRLICAHEVAHQWWGHWVGWSNYRDQWLSEGLAVFSSSLFAQRVYGNDYMNEYWEELKEQLTNKNRRRIKPIDVGGLEMGYRLDTGKTGLCSQAVTYAKGGYILHMLRMIMWDPKEGDSRFFAMLKDLVTSCDNDFITTQDFKAHVEKHMTPKMNLRGDNKMDWFFDQWVYGTQLPHYSIDYKITRGNDGKPLIFLKVKQSQVSDDFIMLVPVYGKFGKGIARICQVRLEGNEETQTISIPLAEKPDKLMICAQHDILCEVK